MTASHIIEEIEALPPDELLRVVRFAYRLDAERKLTGGELSALAEEWAQHRAEQIAVQEAKYARSTGAR